MNRDTDLKKLGIFIANDVEQKNCCKLWSSLGDRFHLNVDHYLVDVAG